jgi:serine phosphatase RsbU (regulator of sigma subunit)
MVAMGTVPPVVSIGRKLAPAGRRAGGDGEAGPVVGATGGTAGSEALTVSVLLVEDDEGDAVLVTEWLSEVDEPIELTRVRTLGEAIAHRAPVDCILLDLGLPDAIGLDGVRRLQEARHDVAVVVLTGRNDSRHGALAVAAGAQDYMVKNQATGELLARTIRYAVQRQRSETVESELLEERIRASENTRLERGLLPQPLYRDATLTVTSRYRSGGQRLLLGGDFFDVVEDTKGSLHIVIGDVAGHGPDQAALGVALRIAWRTLVFTGQSDQTVLPILSEMLDHERHDPIIFATMCTIIVAPDRRSASMYLAGHPAPLLRTDGVWSSLPQRGGPALGLIPNAAWSPVAVPLPEDWELLLYTDGAIEGRVPGTGERLGVDGLARLVTEAPAPTPKDLLQALVTRVTDLNGGPLTDDLALLHVGRTGPPSAA